MSFCTGTDLYQRGIRVQVCVKKMEFNFWNVGTTPPYIGVGYGESDVYFCFCGFGFDSII